MRIFIILLYAVKIVTCLLLIGVVLLQRSKDSGTGLSFGSGMGESLFGAHVGNVLTRATVVLGSIFLGIVILLSILTARETGVVREERAVPLPSPPASSEGQPVSGDWPADAPAAP